MGIFHFIQAIAFLPVKTFYPTKFIGKNNIPKGPCIIASNHRSNMDAILLAMNTWEKKYYLAKKEIFSNKFKAAFFKGIGAIKIDRQANDIVAMKQCLNVLKKGKKLVIFPEGTRVNNENDELGQMKQGAVMFAIKAKVPIVPMYIAKKPKAFRRNRVFVGKPFTLEEFYGVKLNSEELAKAGNILEEKIKELQTQAQIALTKKK